MNKRNTMICCSLSLSLSLTHAMIIKRREATKKQLLFRFCVQFRSSCDNMRSMTFYKRHEHNSSLLCIYVWHIIHVDCYTTLFVLYSMRLHGDWKECVHKVRVRVYVYMMWLCAPGDNQPNTYTHTLLMALCDAQTSHH